MEPDSRKSYLQCLPAVDEVLHLPQIQAQLKTHSREFVLESIRRVLARKRQRLLSGRPVEDTDVSRERILAAIEDELADAGRLSLRPVINATGVVLHTNLGRAPLSSKALEHIVRVARGYVNLEFDLQAGERGSRYEHVEQVLCRLSGAESALVVNNNAGAVFLGLNGLAEGKEVIVSRGELVEIGGSFRIPDIMRKSGAQLVEVGTTNRTHRGDYEAAISDNTALLLKVHLSNFRMLGFTAEVSLKDLVSLGHARGLPVMVDLGSGCLVDLAAMGMEKEPTVREAVETGADVVTFSGDKLLGGPQAGVIVGRKTQVDRLKKNPLHRALRIDKLTLAGLEATLREYFEGDKAVETLPVLRMLSRKPEEIRSRVERLQSRLAEALSHRARVSIRPENSQVGGGALPLQALPTFVVAVCPLALSAAAYEERLRKGMPSVVARIKEDEVLFDARTVAEEEEEDLLRAATQALSPF
jgi:L-seryl-tRNA(Ser) seleniumtransferase